MIERGLLHAIQMLRINFLFHFQTKIDMVIETDWTRIPFKSSFGWYHRSFICKTTIWLWNSLKLPSLLKWLKVAHCSYQSLKPRWDKQKLSSAHIFLNDDLLFRTISDPLKNLASFSARLLKFAFQLLLQLSAKTASDWNEVTLLSRITKFRYVTLRVTFGLAENNRYGKELWGKYALQMHQ